MIRFKRQGGGNSSYTVARPPTSLAYGEPAIASDGTIYVGSGNGGVVSKVKQAELATRATTADRASNATNANNATRATNADRATRADYATNSDEATNGLWEFSGTYRLDSWRQSGSTYTQTVSVTAAYGGKRMNTSARLSDPLTSQTSNFDTNQKKLAALAIINAGLATPGNGSVTITCKEKPTCDIDVHWYVKL